MSDQPPAPRIPPGMLLHITLPAQQWFGVLSQLAEGPFKTVGPLIGEIERQIMRQTTEGAQQAAPMAAQPRAVPLNGQEDPSDARH